MSRPVDSPRSSTPTRPPHVNNFPEIEWSVKHSPGLPYYLEYEGSDGVITPRYVMVVCEGRGNNGQDYIGAFDGEWFKTFRGTAFGLTTRCDTAPFVSAAFEK